MLNVFFKVQTGLGPQCPKCAEVLLRRACQGKQDRIGLKGTERKNPRVDKVIAVILVPAVALRHPLTSLHTQVSIFFRTNDDSFYLSAHFRRIIHQQSQELLEIRYSNLESHKMY